MSLFDVNLTISGLQERQDQNLRAIAALRPDGEFGEAVLEGVTLLHRYAVSITHVGRYKQAKSGRWYYDKEGPGVGGGALRASHLMEVRGLYGRVYINPAAVSPRTGGRPSIYGIYENAHGGSHAFYDRTVSEYGAEVTKRIGNRVVFAVVSP